MCLCVCSCISGTPSQRQNYSTEATTTTTWCYSDKNNNNNQEAKFNSNTEAIAQFACEGRQKSSIKADIRTPAAGLQAQPNSGSQLKQPGWALVLQPTNSSRCYTSIKSRPASESKPLATGPFSGLFFCGSQIGGCLSALLSLRLDLSSSRPNLVEAGASRANRLSLAAEAAAVAAKKTGQPVFFLLGHK